ncbi:hypothetical protein Sango_2481200 [Sesamum angolense]|uniref:Endonuclease/exonuclease/phosphatase domain-containing protein n=1 Tax=Sesamum angolense TaxID=2727404 RepID=A0AAE2BI19_9LAMI|nr:hypothetical protein Sango_2481200 [Sesamum angolense]
MMMNAKRDFTEARPQGKHCRDKSVGHPEQGLSYCFLDFILSMGNQPTPWFIGGDFNSVVSFSESKYTWTDHRIGQRLHQELFSSAWVDEVLQTYVKHLPRSSSDHCPLLITLKLSSMTTPSSFRFQNMWARYPDFLTIVKDNWFFPTTTTSLC